MKLEWNDLRCLLTVINVTCVFLFGGAFAIIGAAVAAFGLVKDFMTDKRINGFVMHGVNLLMYLCMIFGKIAV